MLVDAEIIKGTSKKGNDYYCIEIELPNGYKMRYFPTGGDSFILAQCYEEYNGKE